MKKILFIFLINIFFLSCSNPSEELLKQKAGKQAVWIGTWKSKKYFPIYGSLAILMPDPLPLDTNFSCELVISYGRFSFYKGGTSIKTQIDANFTLNKESKGTNRGVVIDTNEYRLSFLSKGNPINPNQILEYSAIVNENVKKIKGDYISKKPFDIGTFTLKRKLLQ